VALCRRTLVQSLTPRSLVTFLLILFRRHLRRSPLPVLRRSTSRNMPTKRLSDAVANSRAL
jgi:hypothetical protein